MHGERSLLIGIFGAGQLGYFLCEAAHELGMRTFVVAQSPEDPATTVADEVIIAPLDDVSAAEQLAARCDVITFEVETIGAQVLDYLEHRSERTGLRVFPRPDTMRKVQSKVRQKVWLHAAGIPTLPHRELPADTDAAPAIVSEIGYPFVQKAASGGYDGRGVQVIRSPERLVDLWPVASIIEPFLANAVEAAVVGARSIDGQVLCYEPIALAMDPNAHVLDEASYPGGFDAATRGRLMQVAEQTIATVGDVGVIAVEMFVTPQGEALVNEISPRVHNSGHLTLDVSTTSQFHQHIRAIAGLPLSDCGPRQPAAVMKNLLAPCELPGGASSVPEVHEHVAQQDTRVYWYGKRNTKPLRKMGHVTALGGDVETARARAAEAWRELQPAATGAAARDVVR